MIRFDGVFAVLPTPFHQNGAVDVGSLRRVVRLYLDAGVDGLTALGVTSEVASLDDAERDVVLGAIMDETRGSRPVVVGATAQQLDRCIQYVSRAMDAGATAVMVSPPRMPSLDGDAVRQYFAGVAAASRLPIVIQDYPEITGYSMPPSLLASVVRDLDGHTAIKLEDAPSAPKIAQLRRELDGAPAAVFGGLGGVFLLEELLAGAAGVMTGFAFPEVLVEIVRLFRSGQTSDAAEWFYRGVPLIRFEFQRGIGLAIRKELLRRRGVIEHPIVRPPNESLGPETVAALDQLWHWYGAQPDFPWI